MSVAGDAFNDMREWRKEIRKKFGVECAALTAARAVVWTALHPTVTDLQASAHDLYDRMIRCEREAGNATPAA